MNNRSKTKDIFSIKKLEKILDSNSIAIISTITEDNETRFAYTVGMNELGLADVYMSANLPLEIQNTILNEYSKLAIYRETNLMGLLEDIVTVPILVVKCENSDYFLDNIVCRAELYYDCHDVINREYVQIILPDKHGLFPFEKGYDDVLKQDIFVDLEKAKSVLYTFKTIQ